MGFPKAQKTEVVPIGRSKFAAAPFTPLKEPPASFYRQAKFEAVEGRRGVGGSRVPAGTRVGVNPLSHVPSRKRW